MSFRKLFSSSSASKTAGTETAVQKLRDLEEIQQRKCEFLEKKIQGELEFAKANSTKNRKGAIAALKRKKKYEEQLKQAEGTLSNVERQREVLENAKVNAEIMRTMNQASKSLKHAHKELNPDKVQETLDDFEDQQYLAKEIGDAISTPTSVDVIDEDELLAELTEYENEALSDELLSIGNLPQVPAGAPKGVAEPKSAEEKELEELAAMMAS